jgi:hypothetical protein
VLFKTAWQTIDEFARDPRQNMMAKTGMIAILHTCPVTNSVNKLLACFL